ncbi:MAG: acyl-CoA/acyl-ACP dehydrogenase [Candidatus Saccharimonas sp.]|nr:acyl-CoA/acyl-ACP dehydrogenase [Planctomycetaceae bacterium]
MRRLVDGDLAERLSIAADPEATGEWPIERLARLVEADGFRWGLPQAFGGIEVSEGEMLDAYIDLARQCLTTAFVLTQRNAACQRIAASPNAGLRQRLLPEHCAGRQLATVGISHLSTSRQHWSRPSVAVIPAENGFEFSGEAPWVTGGRHADLLVTGGSLPDGQQILVAIPTDRVGLTMCDPLRLLALNGSHTGSVMLDRVAVDSDEVLAGPVERVMQVGATGGTGSLTTSAVALGAAARSLAGLEAESTLRRELVPVVDELLAEHSRLKADLLRAATVSQGTDDSKTLAEQLRFRANSLVSRTALAWVASAKGAGYVTGHPAERALREAMFFHVWSCPPAVTTATLNDLMLPVAIP